MVSNEMYDFSVETLGKCEIRSPIKLSTVYGENQANYVKDDSYVINAVNVFDASKPVALDSTNLMQKAGPREYIFFDPKDVKAGICTCGGLCPGLNDVIRAIVRSLWNRYGVRDIRGFQFGYKGFFEEEGYPTIALDPRRRKTCYRHSRYDSANGNKHDVYHRRRRNSKRLARHFK